MKHFFRLQRRGKYDCLWKEVYGIERRWEIVDQLALYNLKKMIE